MEQEVIKKNHRILPTDLRQNADPRFTGKGVTICFIDSEFYPHPDLIHNKNRIKAIIDIPANRNFVVEKTVSSWHGTMTSVVCAGDGYLSNGLYRGIASDAELVLLKVQDNNGKITDDNITRALEWVLHNHYRYQIRIVNISLGSDELASYKKSRIDMLAEKLNERGIVVVAAVGNDENGDIKAPANSPHVISVGGIDELGRPYHSNFGNTVDNLMKPELVAQASGIMAPYEEYYKLVDGTSFAAPFVSAVIAQMLEINPGLTPSMIRASLLGTAKRLPGIAAERQGYGLVQPRKAVIRVLNRQIVPETDGAPCINSYRKTISFSIRHECASQISLAGSFNNWIKDEFMLEPGRNGIWTIEIPLLPAGRYAYKFFVDGKSWVEDVNNPFREPDGFSGFNSILMIEN